MMISDGFGPASETFARQYFTQINKREIKSLLPLDEIHVGHSRTQSSSSLITDSAAGATAFACAHKSYNGAIGVYPNKKPCGTVLESAKVHKNMLTGLVVTSRITHATPASFSAHVPSRDWEAMIAEQQIGYSPLGRTVDLMFGGGSCEFLSNSTEGSCRMDNRDLFTEAKEKFGWDVKYGSREHLDELSEDEVQLPLMALFSLNVSKRVKEKAKLLYLLCLHSIWIMKLTEILNNNLRFMKWWLKRYLFLKKNLKSKVQASF